MAERAGPPLIVVAAGGTGGHLFPAEALAVALTHRGFTVDLATDERATRYGAAFPAHATHVVPSATFSGRNPIGPIADRATLGRGLGAALELFGRRQTRRGDRLRRISDDSAAACRGAAAHSDRHP